MRILGKDSRLHGFLSSNPMLSAVLVDFNQSNRFKYIIDGLKILLKTIPIRKENLNVLDVGAGLGILSDCLLRAFGGSVVNVEITSSNSIDNLVVANGTCLPFRDNSFDFTVSSDVLEHLSCTDRSRFEKELLRCCKYGTVFTYSKMHSASPHPGGIRVFERLCSNSPDWYLEHNSNELVDDLVLKSSLEEDGAQMSGPQPIGGVFAVFLTGINCFLTFKLTVKPIRYLVNLLGYLTTKQIDLPPYYNFGLLALKKKKQ